MLTQMSRKVLLVYHRSKRLAAVSECTALFVALVEVWFFFSLYYDQWICLSPNPTWHLDLQGSLLMLNRPWGSWDETGGGTLLECSVVNWQKSLFFTRTCSEFVQHWCYGNKQRLFEHGTEEKCTLHTDYLFWNVLFFFFFWRAVIYLAITPFRTW